MALVQLFVYQDDCIFQPYELFLDIETTCRAEMKPVAWRFVLFPDQFVRECKLAAGRWGIYIYIYLVDKNILSDITSTINKS